MTVKKYVAVGFKVSEDKSIFYFKEEDFDKFCCRLKGSIEGKNPDFVSLRMIK